MLINRLNIKKSSRLISLLAGCLLIAFFLWIPWQANADAPIQIVINNQVLTPEVSPLIVNGRVLVPLRFIAEALNAEVAWEESTRTVAISTKNNGGNPAQNVPVRPNASIVYGKVLGYAVQDPSLFGMEGTAPLYLLDLKIERSENIPGEFNFIENRTGSIIKAYVSSKLPADIYGKSISGRITYHGDEHGGKYWLSEVAPK